MDDRQSQWGMAKFDPQPTLNPWTDRHQIWNMWLRRGYLPPQQIRGQYTRDVLPLYAKYTPQKPSKVYFTFFSVLQVLQKYDTIRQRSLTWTRKLSIQLNVPIARPRKPPVIRKDLVVISYISRVIADYVPNFVAMATGVLPGVIRLTTPVAMEIFTYNRGFRGRAIEWRQKKFYHDQPLLPWQRNSRPNRP